MVAQADELKTKPAGGNETYKDFSLVRQMLTNYDPDLVDKRMSPNETMKGDNYIWVGATGAEVVMASVMASRLTDVGRVLDLPCGHGRVLRHLVRLFPHAQFDACDLDTDGVNFCAETFNARPILSQEDLTNVTFDTTYDLIWIGSLFTHTSYEITKSWLAFLAGLLSENGIIVATFHGRWATRLHKLAPYIDDERWTKIIEGYHATGYGYDDYPKEGLHDFIQGSYGLSVAKPHALVRLLENIPGTRIYMYQEKAWGDNHDVIVFGRPNWDQSWW